MALNLHESTFSLPDEFSTPLIKYVKESKSHVGTLNYDKLIYDKFLESGVLSGYSGVLVDGCLDVGFNEDNMKRLYGRTFGYYMHLHGSPLFFDHDGVIYKYRRFDHVDHRNEGLRHIVLTHIKHKVAIIESSYILRTYWRYLIDGLNESGCVVLFGYSGMDVHLNTLLMHYNSKKKYIVEWSGAGSDVVRNDFWKSKMGNNFELIRLDNVLDFKEWDRLV
ncbi:hypothetical protein [Chromobacterium violaceum]|uniref:hypothetical protein n=1 Tax=Chromobacterium violaceum TaxID=536 RepID=UPI0019529973|nr:hypothetical protein [Chromobacterium violaceum]MBX9268697.1 SIR2 family protein [Chromobacterium violaceum]QRO35109.1 hypothetical protein I6K04_10545 [Chromobacterium violaceum]QRQ15086.1 hypothetical protein I6K03_12185 [Chromobacterium violaceum]